MVASFRPIMVGCWASPEAAKHLHDALVTQSHERDVLDAKVRLMQDPLAGKDQARDHHPDAHEPRGQAPPAARSPPACAWRLWRSVTRRTSPSLAVAVLQRGDSRGYPKADETVLTDERDATVRLDALAHDVHQRIDVAGPPPASA